MERNKGNILVKRIVIVVDFAILNLVLLAYILLTPDISPAAFDLSTKMTFFAANASMFIAESMYSTIIHIRRVSFMQVCKRAFCLSGLASILFFLSIRLLINYGGLFYFSLLFLGSFYVILVISRALELVVLKYFRTKGYNSRTAIFVGNDPAVLDMYNTLAEDPSSGYRVNGYFADADIVGAPKEFVRLGTLTELNEIVDCSINNTIHGAPTNMHEMFCCLSHDQSKEVIRLMQYCDKNVIHFYYLPRQFEGYKLHLDALQFMGKSLYTNHIEPLSNTTNRVLQKSVISRARAHGPVAVYLYLLHAGHVVGLVHLAHAPVYLLCQTAYVAAHAAVHDIYHGHHLDAFRHSRNKAQRGVGHGAAALVLNDIEVSDVHATDVMLAHKLLLNAVHAQSGAPVVDRAHRIAATPAAARQQGHGHKGHCYYFDYCSFHCGKYTEK